MHGDFYSMHIHWIHTPVFTLVLLVFFIRLVVIGANRGRRHAKETDLRLCPSCGTPHPPHAKFCRQCGRGLLA